MSFSLVEPILDRAAKNHVKLHPRTALNPVGGEFISHFGGSRFFDKDVVKSSLYKGHHFDRNDS